MAKKFVSCLSCCYTLPNICMLISRWRVFLSFAVTLVVTDQSRAQRIGTTDQSRAQRNETMSYIGCGRNCPGGNSAGPSDGPVNPVGIPPSEYTKEFKISDFLSHVGSDSSRFVLGVNPIQNQVQIQKVQVEVLTQDRMRVLYTSSVSFGALGRSFQPVQGQQGQAGHYFALDPGAAPYLRQGGYLRITVVTNRKADQFKLFAANRSVTSR